MAISQGLAFQRAGFSVTAAMDSSQGHPGKLVMAVFNSLGQTDEERYGMSLAMKEFIPSQYAGPHPGQPAPGRPSNSLAPGLVVPVFAARNVEVVLDRWLVTDLNMLARLTEWVIDQALALGLVKAEEPPSPPPVGGQLSPPAVDLHSTMDAMIWAKEFVRINGGDVETMLGWFANAIMVGYDTARNQQPTSGPPTGQPHFLHPLSPASVRAEEVQSMLGKIYLSGLASVLRDAWLDEKARPLLAEALRFYRLLRKRLGDPREIPAEDR